MALDGLLAETATRALVLAVVVGELERVSLVGIEEAAETGRVDVVTGDAGVALALDEVDEVMGEEEAPPRPTASIMFPPKPTAVPSALDEVIPADRPTSGVFSLSVDEKLEDGEYDVVRKVAALFDAVFEDAELAPLTVTLDVGVEPPPTPTDNNVLPTSPTPAPTAPEEAPPTEMPNSALPLVVMELDEYRPLIEVGNAVPGSVTLGDVERDGVAPVPGVEAPENMPLLELVCAISVDDGVGL